MHIKYITAKCLYHNISVGSTPMAQKTK